MDRGNNVINKDSECPHFELVNGEIVNSDEMNGALCCLAVYGKPKNYLENNKAGIWCNRCQDESKS